MKIYAVSDMHGRLDGLDPSGCGVCVVAGDFAPLGGFGRRAVEAQAEWVRTEFCGWIRRFPGTEFVITPGNHDMFADPRAAEAWPGARLSVDWPANARMLVNSGCEVRGLRFWGSPNVPVISYSWAFESERDELAREFTKIPEGIDVLVMHGPPRVSGYFGDVSLDRGVGSEKFGSTELADAIFRVRPRLAFFGHIHSGDHSPFAFEGAELRNVSRVGEDYAVKYAPAVVDV